jgi:hypothetical protein
MHAIIRATGPEAVSKAFRDESGTSHPANVLSLWSDEELSAIGVYRVRDIAIPENKVTSGGWTLFWDGTEVTRTFNHMDPPTPTLEQQQQARAEAYRDEADPLFFKAQRDEASLQDWQDKIQEIRTRFPYPE